MSHSDHAVGIHSRLMRFVAILAGVFTLGGGCSCSENTAPTAAQLTPEEEAKAARKKPFEKPDLNILPQFSPEPPKSIVLKPGDPAPPNDPNAEPGFDLDYVKPRHWVAVRERRQSNDEDLPGGELVGEMLSAGSQPMPLENVPYGFSIERDVALAKGRPKFPEYRFYVTPGPGPLWSSDLRNRENGADYQPYTYGLSRLATQSYLFVVLTEEPTRYKRWPEFDTMRTPGPGGNESDFRVVVPILEKTGIPLPRSMTALTMVSAMLWDGIDPDRLSAEQKSALVDWLHWGGVLIVNGPTSLDKLKGSFLDGAAPGGGEHAGRYLPVQAWRSVELDKARLPELNNYWSERTDNSPEQEPAPGVRQLRMTRPWSVLDWTPTATAETIPRTADTVIAGNVGRGRIVVTAFNLKQKEFNDWPGNDSFINAALLGRGPRVFESLSTFEFHDSRLNYYVRHVDARGNVSRDERDSYHNTKLRILTRDWHEDGLPDGSYDKNMTMTQPRSALRSPHHPATTMARGSQAQPWAMTVDESDEKAEPQDPYLERTAGGWSDANPLADASRAALGEASGIKIPEVSFVVTMLLTYLGVLVLLNYGFFRIIGRVEYAWVAAPIIALAGSITVIKMAQLDIGFARSQTEIAVLECYDGHPRGLLTRYTGLYSSLSTTYELQFSDGESSALPFAARDANPVGGGLSEVVLKQADDATSLRGFQVISNSNAMLHSEQPYDLGGSISGVKIDDRTIEVANRGTLDLTNAVVVQKTDEGEYRYAWLGDLSGKTSASFTWTSPGIPAENELFATKWQAFAAVDSPDDAALTIPLGGLLKTLSADKTLRPGEVRLIGIVAKQLPGMTVVPTAAQSDRSTTIVVAHLRTASAWSHERDRNWRAGTLKGEQLFDERMEAEEDAAAEAAGNPDIEKPQPATP